MSRLAITIGDPANLPEPVWKVHARFSRATFAVVICVSVEKRVPAWSPRLDVQLLPAADGAVCATAIAVSSAVPAAMARNFRMRNPFERMPRDSLLTRSVTPTVTVTSGYIRW